MVQVRHDDITEDWKLERERKTSAILKAMGDRGREQNTAKLAASASLPYVDLQVLSIDRESLFAIPEEDARRLGIASFHKSGPRLRVAIADPTNKASGDYLAELGERRDWRVERFMASQSSLDKAWSGYKDFRPLDDLDLWRVSLKGDELKKFEDNFGDLLKLKQSDAVPISQTIEIILAGASKLRASDIHIEPSETDARLRYRIDGMLQEIGTLPLGVYRLTLSRVKMLAKMKINVRDRAQDGHFEVELGGRKADLRVSIIPGNHGENINLRILNASDVMISSDNLGMSTETHELIMRAADRPHGMIINTGPTGSGKTTTLYSILSQLNKPEVKIITIEDPIEYQIPGIVQTEVTRGGDYTFGSALRAVVRQDPDIILVGEIRDDETADTAINAALTGHLLLSTIHANSAPGAVPRLIEMGVKPTLIASAVNIIIGQRLVRRLCTNCHEAYVPAEETVNSLMSYLSLVSPKAKFEKPGKIEALWRPKGCAECNLTGYWGRIGIFEVLTITKRVEDLILELGTEKELMAAAIDDGMVTMLQDGIVKAIKGMTSLEEVWHVTGQQDFLETLIKPAAPATGSAPMDTADPNV